MVVILLGDPLQNYQNQFKPCFFLSSPNRWEPFPEFVQERSSVNLVSAAGVLYAVGGFAVQENEDKQCVPSENTDIWQ